MKLNVKASAISAGVIAGLAVAVATIFSLLRGTGATLGTLMVVFPGYSVSGAGIIIGFLYGFVYGAVGGALLAVIYNVFAEK